MIITFSDPALIFRTANGELQDIIDTYVDDTLSTRNSEFDTSSKSIEEHFESERREYH